jgi:alpha-L-arabinofuranosidase
MRLLRRSCGWFLFGLLLFSVIHAGAQASLPIYTNYLVNGFQNYSWATVNFSTVYGGSNCVSVVNNTNYQAVYFGHADFNTSPYNTLDFWINGGSNGGQQVQVAGALNGNAPTDYSLGKLHTNTWQHFTIPLSSLDAGGATNCSGFWIQGASNDPQPVFYVCNMQLIAAPAPATVHLNVNAARVIRTADARWFGLNTAVWDNEFDTAHTSNLMAEIGCTTFRFPGGSLSDTYNWAANTNIGNKYPWATPFANFIPIATNLGAQVFITVNYGTGSSNEAAAWVACANITNDCDFKYWEVGNEVYGTWEVDSNTPPNDPYTYATRAVGYMQLMKAKDPTIKIGAVAEAGEDSYINDYDHAATNPITGQVHYGWTPVMLATFKNLGIYPDFLIYHDYPEYTTSNTNSADSDPLLLQIADNYDPAAWTDWASAAQNLRMQLTDYLGNEGSNIELCVTENNSDAGSPGRQSTSIVNALYLADSLGQLMQTEFNSMIWWDLRNGPDTTGDYDPTLYGWRPFGDLGITWGSTNYPVFYAKKLLQSFVRGGDSVVGSSSDYLLLSDYAVRRTNGSLTVLVINKDVTTSFNAQIILTNFLPAPNATIQSYGIVQDNAARTNATASLQDIATNNFAGAGTNFTYTFPAGTMTLFTFAPAAVKMQSSIVSGDQFVLGYWGQTNTPYVLQESSNLVSWMPAATNISKGGLLLVTNNLNGVEQYWRVLWEP